MYKFEWMNVVLRDSIPDLPLQHYINKKSEPAKPILDDKTNKPCPQSVLAHIQSDQQPPGHHLSYDKQEDTAELFPPYRVSCKVAWQTNNTVLQMGHEVLAYNSYQVQTIPSIIPLRLE